MDYLHLYILQKLQEEAINMIRRILLVGPALMPIPTDGWGAVESVIWQQKQALEHHGIEVKILNEKGLLPALRAKPWKYDIVHLHYDDFAGFWNKLSYIFRFTLITTSHYGYSAYPDRWNSNYRHKIIPNLLKSKNLFLLNEKIKNLYIKMGAKGKLYVVPNGIETEKFLRAQPTSPRALCLGKIEPRKKQASLSKILNSHKDIQCDFIGPIVDSSFSSNNINTHYRGEWSREDVYKRLSQYSCLILLSDGEAHPLVVGEALAAGLSLVITEEASGNLDKKPWIHVTSLEESPQYIRKACIENAQYREEIIKYAQKFSWGNIIRLYLKNIDDILNNI